MARAELASKALSTPIGQLTLAASNEGLTGIGLPNHPLSLPMNLEGDAGARRHLTAAMEALSDYFAGELQIFEGIALAPKGTDFQLAVWRALYQIPFGETRSYGAIAREIGEPKAMRAVGMANGRNPLPIIIPCHRVIGANGSLTGFGGGLPTKKWLLEFEATQKAGPGTQLSAMGLMQGHESA